MVMKKAQKKLIFIALFSVIAFVALQIPFTKLVGSNVSFTLFDFFGPIAGAFLGPVVGVASVLGVEIFNFVVKQEPVSAGSIIRLVPILFSVYYFAVMSRKKDTKWILFVPVVSILAFLTHPNGREAWYFTLFWTIPLISYFKRDMLLVRSLGATFTAHAVGGAAWIWAFNLPASVWQGLIPVVISERILFAFGIAASYLVMKHSLSFMISKKILPQLDTISQPAKTAKAK